MFEDGGVPADFGGDVEALGGAVMFAHEAGIAAVTGLSEEAAAELGAREYVTQARPDLTFQLQPTFGTREVETVAGGVTSPEDPSLAGLFAWQWNMRAIDADDTWAAGRVGSADVTVAILDTGIDYEHHDLQGLVDLDRSVSFVPGDEEWIDLFFPGREYFTDIHFHGTHVASIVASNGLALAGVTSMTTLMAVKVCDVYGLCEFSAVMNGILYAADNGADVANLSLGGGFLKAGAQGFHSIINRVFNFAHSQGVTIVVAAGNESTDLDHYPNLYKTYCDSPNAICVSATGPTSSDNALFGDWYEVDAPAPYTNFGRWAINVAAPGGTNAGPVWGACSSTSLWYSCPQTPATTYILALGGTSQATPHVSGLASLMVEDVGRKPGQVRARIQQGADDLGPRGTDPFYGKGRINVFESAFLRKAKNK